MALWLDLIHLESPIENVGMSAGLAWLAKVEDCVSESMTWFDGIVGMCCHGGIEVRLTPDGIGEQESVEPCLTGTRSIMSTVMSSGRTTSL